MKTRAPRKNFPAKNSSKKFVDEKILRRNLQNIFALKPVSKDAGGKIFKKFSRQKFEQTQIAAESTSKCSTWNSLREIFKQFDIIPCAARRKKIREKKSLEKIFQGNFSVRMFF